MLDMGTARELSSFNLSSREVMKTDSSWSLPWGHLEPLLVTI